MLFVYDRMDCAAAAVAVAEAEKSSADRVALNVQAAVKLRCTIHVLGAKDGLRSVSMAPNELMVAASDGQGGVYVASIPSR